ncbi:vacuolar amino acid transporter YPQ3-like protein 2 [Stagonosporopsis vannaccii]|nr:vacuolar amino acid transporter YPQ3-like protein 2 [Stagonosporopsis vannaccii]
MFPPAQGLRLDLDAISQIFGSISIACWIVLPKLTLTAVVFSPQIIENWRRSSAEGLSVVFIIIWLLGDFFNIFGAVLQGVLPTMTILAVYYTLADIVLLLQCFWYKGFTLRDVVNKPGDESNESGSSASEDEPLLSARRPANGASYASVVANGHNNSNGPARISDADRRHSDHSQSSFRERFLSIDGTHLSPATPLHGDANGEVRTEPRTQPQSTAQTVLFNLGTILLVMAAGVFGWWLSATQTTPSDDTPADTPDSKPDFNLWGQIFGYICAALYLGSRIPQLLLNYRRKSTDGISMLFFLFACLGNLTYVLSIVVYKPRCKHANCREGEAMAIYGRYIAVNFSWLLGSFGTLILDACVFVQYFMYRKDEDESESEDE